MQRHSSYPLGTIIRDRYIVEDVLGSGGFSVVYLVRDLTQITTAETSNEALFALKELSNQEQHERARLAFEADVLKRLQHDSLPRIYDIQEADSANPAFLVLEYIQGSNLETLRRRQIEQRFSVAEAMKLMAPIIDAMSYLHRQQPPVLHRDIKPANIMVQEEDQHTFLVDFGIAKEYDVDATTTAVRHCTPGYSAPEQYSNLGTDVRTDIYALGATFYCLLTGKLPADSLQRTTMLVSSQMDPIKTADQVVPGIPQHIARALERAMAIGYEQRFASVEDFWQAMQTPSAPPASVVATRPPFVLTVNGELANRSRKAKKSHALGPLVPRVLVFAMAVILLLPLSTSGNMYVLPDQTEAKGNIQHISPRPTAVVKPSSTPTEVPTVQLARAYQGTAYNFSQKSTMNIQLIDIKQKQQSFNGHFISKQGTGNFSGVIDRSNHLLFTIAQDSKQPFLFFEGAARADGNLVGNYCTQNESGQCLSNYGLWSLEPIAKP
ncbi:hypothetical protein KDA_56660 [Dictyobacter alpinus]|uniref:Protein kinase domain-containing protein n=1 Tax=Dictyobacter alpinus TaxID=2014873 RepID=A0A402BFZ1_9CHLR|nr:serine/threonine-protein kinase [Dictyobacter alpinus]GCE30182.1 hypothetical protein KDA_56660 [Dictyobacter alpinus]